MIDEAALKELVHGISNRDRLLLCLSLDPVPPRTETAIRLLVVNAGVANARKMNLGTYLARARDAGLARKLPSGWELTKPGIDHVAGLIKHAATVDDPPPEPIKKLREHLPLIKKEETRGFVEEAVECAERKLFRSAVVLSWVGAVALAPGTWAVSCAYACVCLPRI